MALGLVMNTDKKYSCLANNNVKIIPNVEDFNIIIIKANYRNKKHQFSSLLMYFIYVLPHQVNEQFHLLVGNIDDGN